MFSFIFIPYEGLPFHFNVESPLKTSFKSDVSSYMASSTLIFRGQILIIGNDHFDSTATSEGWDMNGTRDGSPSHPYIIENYKIVSSSGSPINIQMTSVSFIIRNCIFNGINTNAIAFTSVSNAILYNNSITAGGHGIYLSGSDNIVADSNRIINCNWGINIGSTNNPSENVFIVNNSIIGCGDGISISTSFNIQISLNFISSSTGYGIEEYSSKPRKLIISNNTIINSGSYGLSLREQGNSVIYNDFINNSHAISQPQIRSSYPNFFEANFWDGWTGPDNNSDRIVDHPLVIRSDSLSIDYHPSTIPNNPITYSKHFITRPRIIFPQDTTEDNMTISWECFDSMNHSINYSVYYAFEDYNWQVALINESISSYTWNISDYGPNTVFRIKITAYCEEKIRNEVEPPGFVLQRSQHTLLPPVLRQPTNEILSGIETIIWDTSNDSWFGSVYYSLYYSLENDLTWTLVISHIHSTSYNWNTITFPSGTLLRLKIVALSYNFDPIIETEAISSLFYSISNNIESSSEESITINSVNDTEETKTAQNYLGNSQGFAIGLFFLILIGLFLVSKYKY